MTGPEHYRKAEALVIATQMRMLAAAQVHATLALAAATAASNQRYMEAEEVKDWLDTALEEER